MYAWPLSFSNILAIACMEEYGLKVYEIKVLLGISGPKKRE